MHYTTRYATPSNALCDAPFSALLANAAGKLRGDRRPTRPDRVHQLPRGREGGGSSELEVAMHHAMGLEQRLVPLGSYAHNVE